MTENVKCGEKSIWKNSSEKCMHPRIQQFPHPEETFRQDHKEEYTKMFTIGYIGNCWYNI